MDEPNQGPSEPPGVEPPRSYPLDLRFWLIVVTIAGVGGLLLGQGELAGLVAVAGIFAVSHAADLQPSYRMLYRVLALIVPAGAIVAFGGFATVLLTAPPSPERIVGLTCAALGGVAAVATSITPVAAAIAKALFRAPPSTTLRLSARLAVLGALLYPAAAVAFPVLLDRLPEGQSLLGKGSLWGNMIGLAVLGLGAVGFRIRRDWRETTERLGLWRVQSSHWVIIAFGIVALIVVNAGAELIERRWLPELWASDQRINRMIAGGLSRGDTLLLGLSAGVGEEVTLRGALQPRLGVFLSSLLFALLHVQYSWFGVLIILSLGAVLGAIRRRTSTTAAMLVHALYDIIAVFTIQP
jgi:hypothetical protein